MCPNGNGLAKFPNLMLPTEVIQAHLRKKTSWKIDVDTPMFRIESDASIVLPLMLPYVMEGFIPLSTDAVGSGV